MSVSNSGTSLPTPTTTTTQQLQDHVDACIDILSAEWTAPFLLELAVFEPHESPSEQSSLSFDITSNLQRCNITDYLGRKGLKCTRLYFSPEAYPPHAAPCPTPGLSCFTPHPTSGTMNDAGEQASVGTDTEGIHLLDTPPSFTALKKHLESAAFSQCHFRLFSNGGSCRGKNPYRRFLCGACINRARTKRYVASRQTKNQASDCDDLRQSRLVNDRSKARKDGKCKPRRTATSVTDKSCTFCFTIRWDFLGFYISLERNSGCATHRYHFKSSTTTLPTRLLADDERETLGHLAAACCSTGVGQAYLMSKIGRYMSNSKIAHVYGQQHSSSTEPCLENDGATLSEYDHLTQYFETTKDIAYTVLWDVCGSGPTPVVAAAGVGGGGGREQSAHLASCDPAMITTTPSVPAHHNQTATTPSFLMSHTKYDDKNSCDRDLSNDPTILGLRVEGQLSRSNYMLSDDTKVFLAIAWTFKPELRFFKLFPEVIHVDGTSHSTRKKYELITFSVKTSSGQQVVFLRVWLPDQKRYSFRWIFQHVLLGLVPKNIFLRTRLVIGDGDRQQQAEIESAIRDYMPNARFGGCGWHIVDRGWKRYGPGISCFSARRKRQEVKTFFHGIHNWIYSWMRPGYCETREEYQVSLRLLEEYISSDAVKKMLDGNTHIITHLKKFIREHVLVHEKHFLHFLRKDTRFLDVAHNSSHEGTNHGMKSSATAVLPTHSLAKAAEHMRIQGVITTKRLEETSSKSFEQSKLWSVLPTSPYLVKVAEDILRQQVPLSKRYSVVRVARDEFEVCDKESRADEFDVFGKESNDEEEEDPLHSWSIVGEECLQLSSEEANNEEEIHCHVDEQGSWRPPIPRFRRTRTVTWDQEGFYRCSCCHFDRTGIPCVHIHAVVKMLHPHWKGFTHHDVSVRWWSTYICHGFPCHDGEENSLTTRLSDLADCDVKGPVIRQVPPPTLDQSSGYASRHCLVPAYCCVKNYSKQDLYQIFGNMNAGPKEVELEMGLTQTTFDPETANHDEDDSGHGTNHDDDDSVHGTTGVCNLFEESLKQISKTDSTQVFEDAMRDVRGDFRAIDSLLHLVDKPERETACAAISSIVLQLRAAVAQKNNKKRKSSTAEGTQGIIQESHHTKGRTYNTHQPFYH
jgi:MULE transposase domain/SWIM zinc finger